MKEGKEDEKGSITGRQAGSRVQKKEQRREWG